VTQDEIRMLAGVHERSQTLFADGYGAEVISEYAVLVTNPHGVVYTVDPINATCNCAFFVKREGAYPCKHLEGWQQLMQDQLQYQFSQSNPFEEGDLLFCLGRVLLTPGAQAAMEKNEIPPIRLLLRHASGDWGDLDAEDKRANDFDLKAGGRLLSAYHLPDATKVWVITEWNRTATTILCPEEY
jgi:hypothetical protein